MSAVAAGTRGRRGLLGWQVGQGVYDNVFAVAYLGLGTSLLLALANAPLLLALSIVREPLAAWPFFLLLSLSLAPSTAAAFGCFETYQSSGEARVLRTFVAAYRATFRRSTVVGAATAVVLAVLVVDVVVTSGTVAGLVLAPLFVVLAALTLATAVGALAAAASLPAAGVELGLGRTVRLSLFLAVRRWYLTLGSFAVLAVVVAVVSLRPVLGIMALPGFGLYVVWSNVRFSLLRSLG